MKRILSIVLALVLTATACLAFSSCSKSEIKVDPDKSEYVVGICQLVKHDALDAATEGFKQALIDKLGAENVTFDDAILS